MLWHERSDKEERTEREKTGRNFHLKSAKPWWLSLRTTVDFCNMVRVVITFAAKMQNISLYSYSEICSLQSKGNVLSELLSNGLTVLWHWILATHSSVAVKYHWNKLRYLHFCFTETRRGSGPILKKCKKCIMHVLGYCKILTFTLPHFLIAVRKLLPSPMLIMLNNKLIR